MKTNQSTSLFNRLTNFSLSRLARTAMMVTTLLAYSQWAAEAALPPANAPIGNQASATYTDVNNQTQSVDSNQVITYVQAVYALDLRDPGTQPVAPGGQVSFSHVVENTGNATNTISLSVTNLVAGDQVDLSGLLIYAADNSGSPTGPAITNVIVAPGASFKFVVVGSAPIVANNNDTAKITVTARSVQDPTATDSNLDTAIISANAIITVAKAFSQTQGPSPSGPYNVTLTFQNTGNSTATNVTLTDVLSTNLSYVGSALWSGSGTTLTDAAGGDPAGVTYQAVTNSGVVTVTASVASVLPGQSGTIIFQIGVKSNVPPRLIDNIATFTYFDGQTNVGPYNSTLAQFEVIRTPAVSITSQTITNATQGATIYFTNVVSNLGNGDDIFNITYANSTFPAGTSLSIMQTGGANALQDSGSDGIPDTGVLLAGGTYAVVIKATLPIGASGVGPYTVDVRATSLISPFPFSIGVDRLNTISANSVDLTNGGAGGAGAGPEVSPVVTLTNNPNSTVRFTLVVTNTSLVADSYNLSYSTNSSFGTIVLPPGWTVTIRDTSELVTSTTGVIAAGGNRTFYADVAIPAGYAPGLVDVYFRALSPTSGAADRIHDAVRVNTVRSLSVTPDNTGQVFPGGTVVYTHFLANNGNVLEGDSVLSTVSLTTTNNISTWNSIIYRDANNSGDLDGADPVITSLSSLGGLTPGASIRLFVKVFAPLGAPINSQDTTTITATTVNGTYTTTIPAAATATDVSTVIGGDLSLTKEQALDNNNDGVVDTAYTQAPQTQAPGRSIRYRIIVMNTGTQNSTNVVVRDTIPNYTTYDATVPASTTQGTITPISNGAVTGTPINFTIGVLPPNTRVTNIFGVRVNQ